MERSAVISEDGRYRYSLSRRWREDGKPALQWIMLNPSKADADVDDPTIRRCIGFSNGWGYGGIEIYNLFAFRATDPNDLLTESDPWGSENNRTIIDALNAAPGEPIVAAWGAWWLTVNRRKKGPGIARMNIEGMVRGSSRQMVCLGQTKNGSPKHPLYVPYSARLIPFED